MATKVITRAEFDNIAKDVCEHDRWINGANGDPGAKSTIALLNERWERMEKKMDKILNALVGLIVTIFGGIALWFFTVYLPTHI